MTTFMLPLVLTCDYIQFGVQIGNGPIVICNSAYKSYKLSIPKILKTMNGKNNFNQTLNLI